MTKTRIREIKAISKSNSAHYSIIQELITEVESFQKRARRGDPLSEPEELPLAAKVNLKKKARGTQEEIAEYVTELKLTPNDATWFYEKMQENDWKVGKQPVKDWKGRIRTWKAGSFFPSQKSSNGNGSHHGATASSAGPSRFQL